MKVRLLFLVLVCSACTMSARAGTITVGHSATYDFTSIQAAINAAHDGDTIVVAKGTYAENINFGGKNVVLTSTDPNQPTVVETTIIQNPTNTDASVVTFAGSETERSVLAGFTITRGNVRARMHPVVEPGFGGGVAGNGTHAAIRNCVIVDNRADSGGGGLHNCDGPIVDCQIYDNSSNGWGGGLSNCDGPITNCVINYNTAPTGAGLCACQGPITGCTISQNTAGNTSKGGLGAGAYFCTGTISKCTISGNVSYGDGGGLGACTGTITDCTISDNSAAGNGGGLLDCDGPIVRCKILRNKAENSIHTGKGGGLYECDGQVIECEITDNRCSESGGGLFGCGGLMSRCTIARNQALGWHGGGLSQCGWVVACSITDNVAGGIGGGAHQCLSIKSSLVAKNRATLDGGGLYGCREVSNCTVANSQSGRNGGGLFCESGVVVVRNSIFWNNAAVNGNEMYFSCSTGGSDPAQPDVVVEYCDVRGGTAEVTVSAGCVVSWHPANINADPCFATPGADFHLLPNSPCIDAGDPNYSMEPNETDLFGKARLVGQRIDIGAHEYPEEPTWYVSAQWGSDKNGGYSLLTALATIQEAINRAVNGNTVLVYPGVYRQPVDFLGKALTVRSAQDAAVLDVPTYYHAVRFGSNEGSNSALQNLIIRNSSLAILVSRASPTLRNLTIVNNRRGIEADSSARPDISNCIFWNNSEGDLIGCTARYSRLTNSAPGEGNLTLDPMFADPTQSDFHLKSERGRYWPKYDVWVLDKVTSPCIDSGDPNTDPSREPVPNGDRVNMGAYGDTPYASMKELRANPSDINRDGWVNMVDMAMLAEAWLIFDPPSSNHHPSVSIVCPSNNAVFDCKIKQFEIIATTADSDGIVLKVEFFANGEKIGEDADGADGWKTLLTGFKGSRYTLVAVAHDDDGAAGVSDGVMVTVCGPRG